MLLSVLIPTYNNASTIKKCVESALNQDYDEEFEVVVANNASTDGTAEILSSIKDKHLRVITNPKTVDLFSNHKILLQAAKSDYVVFLHSDDELLPDALKIIAHKLEERLFPKRYILWGHSLYQDVGEWISGMHNMLNYNTMFSGELAKYIMLSGKAPQPTGTCYSRQTLLDIDGIWNIEECSDWGICAWAAYNEFEFEMSDRIWLKRLVSNTWGKYSAKERDIHYYAQQKAVYQRCESTGQAHDIRRICALYNITFWENAYFYETGTKKQKLEIIKKQIRRSPLKYRKWIKYILVLFGIM